MDLPLARIDAHQHFWILSRRESGWPPPALDRIHRDFLPDDLESRLRRHGVAATVLVQSEASDADTAFLLDLAGRHAFIQAVVGWVDFTAADAPRRIAALAAHPKLRGLRPMLQDIADPAWILQRALEPAIEAMLRHGLRFDALVLPHQLDALWQFVQQHPSLPVVVDHAAKPELARGERTRWRAGMARLAGCPQVVCKLSGLLTEAGSPWTAAQLQPWFDDLLDLFGPDGLMWGSDWPVLEQVSDYAWWVQVCDHLLAPLAPAQRAAVLSGTARRFYGLPLHAND